MRFLICTDVAARGLDIRELPYVINMTLPDRSEDYIHRVGRVGRADTMGLAISLASKVRCRAGRPIVLLTYCCKKASNVGCRVGFSIVLLMYCYTTLMSSQMRFQHRRNVLICTTYCGTLYCRGGELDRHLFRAPSYVLLAVFSRTHACCAACHRQLPPSLVAEPPACDPGCCHFFYLSFNCTCRCLRRCGTAA